MKEITGGVCAPLGFKASGLHCGIKKSKRKDLALIVSGANCLASGSFTTNKIQASCVQFNIAQLKDGQAQAVVVNSGNANCLTGPQGMAHTKRMALEVSRLTNIPQSQVLVGSTGMIGSPLPISKIAIALKTLVKNLNSEGSGDAAHAILTTDRIAKEIALEFKIGGKIVRMGAISKGAGMIHPNMTLSEQKHATMLCYVTTDVLITQKALRSAIDNAVDKTYNRISIDADQSTNDMVIVMANGLARNPVIREGSKDFKLFKKALDTISLRMAKLMVQDGEGATKFCEITVKNAQSQEDAKNIVSSVSSSKLVKTALFGSDPNWGRIAASVGYAKAHMDPSKLQIKLGGLIVLKNGKRHHVSVAKLNAIAARKNIKITIDLNLGKAQATGWTCDLSTGYVRINSAYST